MARKRKNATAYLEGADELNAALRKLSARAGGNVVKEAAEAGAEVIRAEAARNAPKDTGLLREEIKEQPKRLQIGRAQIDVGPSKNAWYGRLVELGTRYIPAQPYLRPAFDARKDEAIAAARKVLERLLDGR